MIVLELCGNKPSFLSGAGFACRGQWFEVIGNGCEWLSPVKVLPKREMRTWKCCFLLCFCLLLWFELCNKNKLDKHFEAADFKRVLDKHVWVPAEHIWSCKHPCPSALHFYTDYLKGLACAVRLGHVVHLFVPSICTWSLSYPGVKEALWCAQCTFLMYWWNCSAAKLFVPCGGKCVPCLGKVMLSLICLLVATCPTLQ